MTDDENMRALITFTLQALGRTARIGDIQVRKNSKTAVAELNGTKVQLKPKMSHFIDVVIKNSTPLYTPPNTDEQEGNTAEKG